ncbi:MAG: class I SAM-dependent methyltransferase, partial [Sneathiella sp.]
TAQRDSLNYAADQLAGVKGVVLEFGLGNGRTYDHLRDLFDKSDIYVFDRHVKAHEECIPDEGHMIIGDFLDSLQEASKKFEGLAKLVHCDVGSGDKAASMSLAQKVGDKLDGLIQKGGIVVSDQPIEKSNWEPLPLPAGIAEGRIYLYRQL